MKWIRQLSKRQKVYVVLVLLLVVGNGIRFMSFGGIALPTKKRINTERLKIKQQLRELSNLEGIKEKRGENRGRVQRLTQDFWQSTGKTMTNQVQLKIERLGRKTGVNLKNVGAPKLIEISDNINAVDVTVSSTTSIKEFSKFLREIENHHPKLIWNNCVIRPNRMKAPTAINVSGKIRAYVLAQAASDYLEEKPL